MGLSEFKVIKTIMVIGSPGIVALVGSHAVEDSGSKIDPSDNAIGLLANKTFKNSSTWPIT